MQIIGSVVITSALTTSAVLAFQSALRAQRTSRLKRSVGRSEAAWGSWFRSKSLMDPKEKEEQKEGETEGLPFEFNADGEVSKDAEFSEEIIREQLARNYVFLGEDGMQKVRKGKVVIVGCGGVGSWAALMLLRSGVSNLVLIDFDNTTLSSLNRHACATLADVGTPKVVACKSYFAKIAPWAKIEIKVGLWKESPECQDWLRGCDWVVDAIDNITTKVQLLKFCHNEKIKVFSSMGAGAKSDPTRVQIADISATSEDRLAKSIRYKLKSAGISSGIPVVFSSEVPSEVKLLPLDEEEFQKGNVKELGAFDDFRVRILPVLGPLPSIFGLTIATYILLDLSNKPLKNPLELKNRKKLYQKMSNDLNDRLNETNGTAGQHLNLVGMSDQEIGFLFEDLHSSRVIFPPFLHPTKPTLIAWDKTQSVGFTNCVVMNAKDAARHHKEVILGDKTGEELWGEDTAERVRKVREEAKRVLTYWID